MNRASKRGRLLLSLFGLVLIVACTPAPASPSATPGVTQDQVSPTSVAPTPTYPSLPAPSVTPVSVTATVDIDSIRGQISDEELEGLKGWIVPFMDELGQMGETSSLYTACQAPGDGGAAGSQYAGQLARDLAAAFGPILDRGMGGASIACIIDVKSSLGGSKITLIYDLTDPLWLATEQQLRHELELAGIPGDSIEGSYAEYDFFPSGSFRIPSITGMGFPDGLEAEISFLLSDVVVDVSSPGSVCSAGEDDVPAGPGTVGEVVGGVGKDLASALGIPLTRKCVTWGQYGPVIAVDLELESNLVPEDTVAALKALLESYGASEVESSGYRLYGGISFKDGNIVGHEVSGAIAFNGNDGFDPGDGEAVAASMGISVTMQIPVN